jgi:putative two-component system response regulator
VAVADVYDALTTRRRYKEAYSHDQACEIVVEMSGRQFDPDLVEAFTEVQHTFREIRQRYSNEADPFAG